MSMIKSLLNSFMGSFNSDSWGKYYKPINKNKPIIEEFIINKEENSEAGTESQEENSQCKQCSKEEYKEVGDKAKASGINLELNEEELVKAVIYSEILGLPRSKRKGRFRR
ncbi:hypothetical protein [Desnuesiella massiliensis]|uniref:hypothetical protein n=1 Tax=Desnuesiella massiliensis TaxID=1650662 RepID=UPI0006E131CE|nr:hypothetical protein [Desnuesiella massiliensis]